MAYRRRGFGSSPTPLPPVMPGMVYCGDGLSVREGTPCPVITPIDPNDPRVKQSQSDWDARVARCQAYQKKEYAVDVGAALLAGLLLPGWWKLLAIPVFIAVELKYPRSDDCDYGF